MDNDQSDTNLADIMLVSPHLSTLSLETYRLKFFAKGSGTLQIGTVNTNSDAVFTEISTGTCKPKYFYRYVVDFAEYTGTDKYFAFKLATGNSVVYVGNVLWEPTLLVPMLLTLPFPQ